MDIDKIKLQSVIDSLEHHGGFDTLPELFEKISKTKWAKKQGLTKSDIFVAIRNNNLKFKTKVKRRTKILRPSDVFPKKKRVKIIIPSGECPVRLYMFDRASVHAWCCNLISYFEKQNKALSLEGIRNFAYYLNIPQDKMMEVQKFIGDWSQSTRHAHDF